VTGNDLRELTATARGPLNRAAAELRKVGATPGEVRRRARRYRERYSVDIALTPMALTKQWPTLGDPVSCEMEGQPTDDEPPTEIDPEGQAKIYALLAGAGRAS
jgi:hypothetical protein